MKKLLLIIIWINIITILQYISGITLEVVLLCITIIIGLVQWDKQKKRDRENYRQQKDIDSLKKLALSAFQLCFILDNANFTYTDIWDETTPSISEVDNAVLNFQFHHSYCLNIIKNTELNDSLHKLNVESFSLINDGKITHDAVKDAFSHKETKIPVNNIPTDLDIQMTILEVSRKKIQKECMDRYYKFQCEHFGKKYFTDKYGNNIVKQITKYDYNLNLEIRSDVKLERREVGERRNVHYLRER